MIEEEKITAEASEHFEKHELQCKCGCERSEMDALFLERLEAVRKEFKRPMQITSAFRCENHPIEKAKVHGPTQKPSGMHPQGRAIDCAVRGADALLLIQIALSQGMNGIGVSANSKTGFFIHLDDRDMDRRTIWSY